MIVKHKCPKRPPFQDAKYGRDRRVANLRNKNDLSKDMLYRCTVCGEPVGA